MPIKNTPNDFQEQAEKIVKKAHSKKVYLIIALVFIAIVLGLLVGIFAVVKNYDSGDYTKPLNNQIIKPIEQVEENYYKLLEKKCAGDNCCLSSLKIMRENNYKEVDKNGNCPDEFEMNRIIWIGCPQVIEWCEPIENEYCVKDGELRTRLKDKCCGESKFVGSANYLSEADVCVSGQNSICLNCGNGICESWENKCNCPEDCGETTDTSDWQTYRNEEFGFEVKLPSNWKAYSEYDGSVIASLVKEFPNNPLILTGIPPDLNFQIEIIQNVSLKNYQNNFFADVEILEELQTEDKKTGLKLYKGNDVFFLIQINDSLLKISSNKNCLFNNQIFNLIKFTD